MPAGTPLEELFNKEQEVKDIILSALTETMSLAKQGIIIPQEKDMSEKALEIYIKYDSGSKRSSTKASGKHFPGPKDKRQRRNAILKLEEKVAKNWSTLLIPCFGGWYFEITMIKY